MSDKRIQVLNNETGEVELDKEFRGDYAPHDVEDWGNMVATLGANWATTRAKIVNLLDDEFPGWDTLDSAGRQLSLFRGEGVAVDTAAMSTQ